MKYVGLGMEQAGSHVKMGTVDVPGVLVWLVKRFGGSGWKRGLVPSILSNKGTQHAVRVGVRVGCLPLDATGDGQHVLL